MFNKYSIFKRIHVVSTLISFNQGAPGPSGPPGPAGANGDKVKHYLLIYSNTTLT